jgi:hypothetical protein
MNRLEAAAEAVAKCRQHIQEIRLAIAAQEEVVAGSELRRQPHVLQAARGDVSAKNALDKLLHEDLAAERTLADLRLVLPQVEAELRMAENAHSAALVEARKAQVDNLARQRVAAAAVIDRALADFSKAWSEYQALGHVLLNLASQAPGANALFLAETVDGVGRLVASLPAKPFLAIREKFNFMPISTSKSLAAAEALYWRLPVDEAKAA